ncbi:response regulator transcription factor [Rhodopila globiformis]|uniref:DNA-binding response regulator n=1 Tax=Rhodopila globiformis TaxID=1071 RepID=A0A2S6NK61_RHOGL|nr:response regulator transcription factor [Rhodopila globiformis]PPQ35228.1 DNA-binding response regulator [Rhodopila globiformis]
MSAARPILIVEDDEAVRQMLVEHVAATGEFQSVEAATLGEASRYLDDADSRFDSIILDINLPDGDGRDFCARVRRQGHRMPIIMLTGATTEEDVVLGLDSGANDYVSKPFRASELMARLNAQLRTFDSSEDAVFTIGPYTFRPASKLLVRADKNQRIRLTSKEVAILKYLYRAGDRVTSRQVLLNEVWGYNTGITTHTLETHIYRLRQKIEVDPDDFCILVTVPGGYRLNAAATVGEGSTAGRPLTS